jgi:hypothetical protein
MPRTESSLTIMWNLFKTTPCYGLIRAISVFWPIIAFVIIINIMALISYFVDCHKKGDIDMKITCSYFLGLLGFEALIVTLIVIFVIINIVYYSISCTINTCYIMYNGYNNINNNTNTDTILDVNGLP